MKRLVPGILIGVLLWGAWIMPQPEPIEDVPRIEVVESADETVIRGFGLCPWIDLRGTSTGQVDLLAMTGVDATMSFAAAGEVRFTTEVSIEGPAGVTYDLENLPFGGQVPTIVEFSDQIAAAAAMVAGEAFLAGDACPGAILKQWSLSGGTTQQGDELDFVFYNPFPEDARVTVNVSSEVGIEPLPDLESFVIPALSSRTVEMDALLGLRDSLSAIVVVEQGAVIPAVAQRGQGDVAMWTGSGRSDSWEFPIGSFGTGITYLALTNSSAVDLAFAIDVYHDAGYLPDALTGTIPAGGQTRVPISEQREGAFGAHVRADGRIGAAVVTHGDGIRAGTVGAEVLAERWLVPSLGQVAAVRNTLWLMNTSDDQVTVAYAPLDSNGPDATSKVAIGPRSTYRVELGRLNAAGLLVEATAPITVAASSERPGGVVFVAGVAFPEN